MAKINALFRSHRLVAQVAVAVIALGAGIGVGFGISDLAGSASPVADPTPTTPTTAPLATPKGTGQGNQQGVRGQITAENGSTWTVLSRSGKTVTIEVTASTQFGTKARPSSASQFVTGSQVAAIGTRSGTTVTATRVVVPAAAGTTGGTSPPTTPPATTTSPSSTSTGPEASASAISIPKGV
ncbi:MAG TPA: hypothetical protein VHT49_05360 [Acidimicrobiales bacterium]|nr:hypothetical protein [Acidimicrobiales bacterium]